MDIATIKEFNQILPNRKSRLLTGPAGIGKSSIIRAFAEEEGAIVIDLKLAQYEPTDIVGFPYMEDRGTVKVQKHAQPWWWPTDDNTKIYLFLDEIDRAKEEMQPLAMQITQDRQIGDRKLSDNVVIWAAGNGPEYMTTPMDQALMDRFAVIDFTPTAAEWLTWATKEKLAPALIEFIKQNDEMLDTPPELIGRPNTVCASRRSWTEFGSVCNNIRDLKNNPNVGKFASSFVGQEYGAAFQRWIKESYKTFSANEIFSGKADPTQGGILEITSSAHQVAKDFVKKTKIEQRNAVNFYLSAGKECFAALYHALPKEASPALFAIPEAVKVLNKLRELQ